MDFVEWCGVVLDRLAGATRETPSYRVQGINRKQISEIVFGEETAGNTEYVDSTRAKGLQQALSAMYHEQLEDVDPSKPFEVLRLTRDGRKGAEDLESGWKWILLKDLDDEQESLLRMVNEKSERGETDHAWLAYVPEEEIVASLRWAGGTDLVRLVTNEMSGHFGTGLIYAGSLSGVPVVRSTYKGLVITSRTDAPKLFDRLAAETPGLPLKGSIEKQDFAFVANPDLQKVLREDYREAQLCLAADAWKGSALLSAGIIEGMLLDTLSRPEVVNRPEFDQAVEHLSRRVRERVLDKGGRVVWDRVGLKELLQLAEAMGILTSPGSRMVEGARDFRDTVHPNAELRLGARADRADAELLIALTKYLYERLSAFVG